MSNILESVIRWWQNHPITSLLITGGAIASSLTNYIKLGELFREWCTEDNKPFTPVEQELEHVINERFGFSFDYPRHWNRKTSTNNDGHIISHPENPKIEIRGWGNYDVLNQGLEKWTEEISGTLGEASITEVSVITRTRQPQMIDGRRLTSKAGKVWSVQLLLEHRGVQASVLCSCPRKLFPQYEKFFVDTCHTLSFTEEPGKAVLPEYDELLRTMPKLMDEMREGLLDPNAQFVREFFVLPNHRVSLGGSEKPRFIFYEDDHPLLLNQLDLLEEQALLKDVTPIGNTVPIYRITERLVEWLLPPKPASQGS